MSAEPLEPLGPIGPVQARFMAALSDYVWHLARLAVEAEHGRLSEARAVGAARFACLTCGAYFMNGRDAGQHEIDTGHIRRSVAG